MIELMLQADRLLNVDQLDAAEALYRRAAEQDPQNAIAVVGLARCEAERGNERPAYDLAVRALAIDPQNNMALRMEARLSEVLAARGQPVERPAWIEGTAAPERAGASSPTREPGPVGTSADSARPGLLGRILGR
jgi:tetratricopeptide (TPR) repeat protein